MAVKQVKVTGNWIVRGKKSHVVHSRHHKTKTDATSVCKAANGRAKKFSYGESFEVVKSAVAA